MAVDQQYIKAAATALAPAVPSEPIFRLTVDQYHQMIAAGVLTDDDRVELLEGWLVPKMPKNPAHRIANKLASSVLQKLIPDGWYLGTQEPITLEDSEPEPDVVIVRGDTRDYPNGHPTAADIAIVIEISDATLARDRSLKKRLYARASIQCYWIVNLIEQQIEVYSLPIKQGAQFNYQQRQDYLLDQEVPLILDGKLIGAVAVQDLLP